uniref:DUF2263 domain-containing protein n=1 Tax=Ascaris lumbricoides TaxID=6252 RepID=A0A0M3ISP9_ASCLU
MKDIPDACSVQWTFVTAFAPWKRGVYERLVGLTKTCLRRSVERRLLSDGELRTLAAEVEAVLNERPIIYIESDDIQFIRPIDYLRPRAHLSVHVERTNEDPEFNPQPPNTRQQLLEQWSKAEECQNKFWEIWSLNDTDSMHNIPLTECQQMQREKRLGPHILQRSDLVHKWTTAYPVQYSYGFFGERCESTINCVQEYGEAILFDDSNLLTEFTRTAGCMPRQNHCFTPHETIIWDYAEFQHRCHYSYKGTYMAQVSADEVFIHALQTVFIWTTVVPNLAETCGIAHPALVKNDVIISFVTNNDSDKMKDQSNGGGATQHNTVVYEQKRVHSESASRIQQRWHDSYSVEQMSLLDM